jgi:hypothetical protein
LVQTGNKEIDACMTMRVRVMGLAGGRRELLVSAAFTALLVACILLLLTGAGPKTRRARAARRAQGPARPGRAPTHLVYEPPSSSATGHGGARAPRPAMTARVELRDRPWRRARAPRPAMAARVELRDRPWRCARAPRPAMAARASSTSPTAWCVAAGERRKGGGR